VRLVTGILSLLRGIFHPFVSLLTPPRACGRCQVVIADLDVSAGNAAVETFNKQRQSKCATFKKMDVTKWDEQVALFEEAKAFTGRIDYGEGNLL
jgi:NAD(P)-dependent dehydrogenase (short-subunit alcohol dehydrogenase family)